MSTDARIDTYIANAQPFARPILTHLRKQVHAARPDIEETLKWGAPAYTLNGKIVCITASFKAHCALSFWAKAMEAVLSADGISSREGMGHLGRITAISDLPAPRKLVAYIKRAAELSTAERAARPIVRIPQVNLSEPSELTASLREKPHAAAAKTWAALTPAKKRDYIEWITTAKRAETRAQRLATTLQWLAEGKTRHWKYASC